MRQERIYSGTVTAGQTVTHTLARGHLNGLLLVGAAIGEGSITVKRRTDHGCAVLAANLGLQHVTRISDIDNGATASPAVLESLRNLLVTDHDGAGAGTPVFTSAQFKQYVLDNHGPQNLPCAFLNLGSIYLGQASDLELEATFTNAGEVRIYAVSAQKTPDMMLQYDQVSDREGHHVKVDALYVSASSGFLLTPDADGRYSAAKDVTLQVEDEEGSYITDISGVVGAASVLGRTEDKIQSSAVRAYGAPQGIPANVFLRVSGANASDVVIIARKAVFDPDAVSVNTVRELRRLQSRLETLEKQEPAVARAYRHAGLTEKASTIASMIANADQPATK